MKKMLGVFLVVIFLGSCKKEVSPIEITAGDYHNAMDRLTNIMVHDIFSPPVASRIYAYSNIAAYEVLVKGNNDLRSFSHTYKDFEPIPEPDSTVTINYQLAALIAHIEMGKQLIFSENEILTYRDSLYSSWEKLNKEEFEVSKSYGIQVATHVANWKNKDNYNETRTLPKFSIYSDEAHRWQPTPPLYMDGIEPHWAKIRTFSLDSASQFQPGSPPEFSLDKSSKFRQELMEVYSIRHSLDSLGDDSEELEMARFWDCNPYVSTQRGHLMFATKKITPGGHWLGITKIASKKKNLDFDNTVYAYTATSLAIADAFISCWDEKYKRELIRPETLINSFVDENWTPVLQTPPFPEYPSGHSVVSGAAATVLTQLFGEDFSYEDDTEVPYGLPVRSFTSFHQAANEAALSRLYGGIHYRSAIEDGLTQGLSLGAFVVKDLNLQPLNL
ncbi:vanadium-dependent haloperoxidase [Antarcticibacterium arcticum]|uniref:Vanadium-dependent haloperoxidase n=1 Tax=Antarcticibacterium arcticum TaxID=2585771 RepID=A0A5B8YLY8_9FLAO|nr:vanadium-dependent haloperoxidase [Antarcticibacterium arcticum]QED37286.1 vanadium-dependent haloperoxidase [Antarcticibacterium arcticum]